MNAESPRPVGDDVLRVQLVWIEPLAVGEAVRRGVGVLDVDEPAVVANDDVRVLVVAEERGDPGQAIGQRPMEQQLAGVGDLGADQQVEVAEPEREEQARQRGVEVDPGLARPARRLLDVVRSTDGIVELVLLGPDDDV